MLNIINNKIKYFQTLDKFDYENYISIFLFF
jgi:hypothetical protein